MFRAPVWLTLALLLLAACASVPQPPAEPTQPSEPQFGSSGDDEAVGVALAASGEVYVVGNSERYETWPIDDRVFLRRYSRAGTFHWEVLMKPEAGTKGYEFYPDALAVAVDGGGNAYVAWAASYQWHPSKPDLHRVYLTKVDRSGNQVWQRRTNHVTGLAVDRAGNVFVAAGGKGYLTKLTPSGDVAWERWGFAEPTGVAVTSAGDVAIVREDGVVAKYTTRGEPLWRKQVFSKTSGTFSSNGRKIVAGPNETLFVAGKHVYDRRSKPSCEGTTRFEERAHLRLYGLDRGGTERWSKNVTDNHWVDDACLESSGWDPAFALSLAADGAGNVYVAGGVAKATSNRFRPTVTDALAAKYTPAGSRAWLKTFGSSGDDHATGVATYGRGEVYVVGVTDGDSAAHANKGYRDAFLRRMDALGNRVWTR